MSENDTQLSFDLFSLSFNQLFEIYFPIKKIKFNKNVHRKEPFMTVGLIISRRTKIRLSSISIKQPTQMNKINLKNYKNIYNKVIRESKRIYFEEALEKNKSNLRKSWQLLKEATRKHNNESSSIKQININNLIVEDEKVIAEHFNNYFTTIADSIAKDINPTDQPPDVFLTDHPSQFNITPVSSQRIIEIVRLFEPKCSKDKDNLSNSFI